MNILYKQVTAAIFSLLLACPLAFADQNSECPAEIINFWKTFVRKSENLEAIPGFLLTNGCLRSTTSTEFYITTLKRLDHPENNDLVLTLSANLDWPEKGNY